MLEPRLIRYEHKSINRRSRQYELLRITQENQAILKRIQARKPDINTEALARDFAESQHFASDITRFPKWNPSSGRRRSSGGGDVKETQWLEGGIKETQQMPADDDSNAADAEGGYVAGEE